MFKLRDTLRVSMDSVNGFNTNMDRNVETQMEGFIKEKLRERFKDDFVFDPILSSRGV